MKTKERINNNNKRNHWCFFVNIQLLLNLWAMTMRVVAPMHQWNCLFVIYSSWLFVCWYIIIFFPLKKCQCSTGTLWIMIIVCFSLIELHDIFYVFFFLFFWCLSFIFRRCARISLRFWHNCMFHVPFWHRENWFL